MEKTEILNRLDNLVSLIAKHQKMIDELKTEYDTIYSELNEKNKLEKYIACVGKCYYLHEDNCDTYTYIYKLYEIDLTFQSITIILSEEGKSTVN